MAQEVLSSKIKNYTSNASGWSSLVVSWWYIRLPLGSPGNSDRGSLIALKGSVGFLWFRLGSFSFAVSPLESFSVNLVWKMIIIPNFIFDG